MGTHQKQDQHDRAGWRKSFLLPSWIAQIILLLGLIGIFAYRLAETVERYKAESEIRNDDALPGLGHEHNRHVPKVEFVWEVTNVSFSIASLLLNIIEMSRLISETLTPFFMLFTHIVKLTLAAAILGLDVVAYIQNIEGNWPIIGLAIDISLLVVTLSATIYSVRAYRRVSKSADYAHPANVKHYGYGGAYKGLSDNGPGDFANTRNSSYSGYSNVDVELGNSTHIYSDSRTEQQRTRAYSGASLSSLASSSISTLKRAASTSTVQTTVSTFPVSPLERRPSYNHKRDTQFDDYVNKRHSETFKDDVDAAIGAEFGWGAGGRNSMERSDSVVGSGSVQVAKVRARGDSVGNNRTKSWSGEQGLVAVPEGPEEEDDHHSWSGSQGSRGSGTGGRRRAGDVDEDRVGLLGAGGEARDLTSR